MVSYSSSLEYCLSTHTSEVLQKELEKLTRSQYPIYWSFLASYCPLETKTLITHIENELACRILLGTEPNRNINTEE